MLESTRRHHPSRERVRRVALDRNIEPPGFALVQVDQRRHLRPRHIRIPPMAVNFVPARFRGRRIRSERYHRFVRRFDRNPVIARLQIRQIVISVARPWRPRPAHVINVSGDIFPPACGHARPFDWLSAVAIRQPPINPSQRMHGEVARDCIARRYREASISILIVVNQLVAGPG